MPMTAQQLGITAPTGGFKQGSHYSARQYWNGTFGEVGALHPESDQVGAGQAVSQEVVKQTNPDNVGFISDQINAANVNQSPSINLPSNSAVSGAVNGLQGSVDSARSNLDNTLGAQKSTIDEQLANLKIKEQENLSKIGDLSTPFREDLEKKEAERLHINKNFEANQALVDELDQLLTEGNDLIKQQREVTGLSAVRNPRIQKAMNDVASRAGVIQAVMNARNGQIGQAQNMIDRTMRAIEADRTDQITYYETILNLNNRDIMSLDAQSQKIAQEQLDLLKGDVKRAQDTQDYVKQLMIDPATAALMGEAGISLTDSVETINRKMTQAQYAREVKDMSNEIALEGGQAVMSPDGVPAGQLITLTDSRGKLRYYKVPAGSKLANGGVAAAKAGTTQAKIEMASKQDMSYLEFVYAYSATMELGDIREAYELSSRGRQFGAPNEDPVEIKAIYDVYSGLLTESEARRKYNLPEEEE